MQDVEAAVAQQSDQPPERQRVEAAARLQQMHGYPGLAEDRHQLAFALDDCCLKLERLPIGVGEQGQQMVFSSATLERGDELQYPDRPPQNLCVNLFGENSLHAALFYGPVS